MLQISDNLNSPPALAGEQVAGGASSPQFNLKIRQRIRQRTGPLDNRSFIALECGFINQKSNAI